MSEIKFRIGNQSQLDNVTKVDGQFLVSKDTNQINAYVDYDNNGTVVRKQIGGREVELTQAEYTALSTAEKNNGTTYYITDGYSAGIGGHIVIDAYETGMTQRSNLKFVNCTVTDDSTIDATVISPNIPQKIAGTVSGTSLAITDSRLGGNVLVDGPYVNGLAPVLVGTAQSSNTITYTFKDDSADGLSAYILVWP